MVIVWRFDQAADRMTHCVSLQIMDLDCVVAKATSKFIPMIVE